MMSTEHNNPMSASQRSRGGGAVVDRPRPGSRGNDANASDSGTSEIVDRARARRRLTEELLREQRHHARAAAKHFDAMEDAPFRRRS
jgi:hypothetical protein